MAAGTWLISSLIAAVLSLVIIAIACFMRRPLLAALLVAAAIGLTVAFFSIRASGSKESIK